MGRPLFVSALLYLNERYVVARLRTDPFVCAVYAYAVAHSLIP